MDLPSAPTYDVSPVSTPSQPLGQTVPSYRVHSKIGGAGMGVVSSSRERKPAEASSPDVSRLRKLLRSVDLVWFLSGFSPCSLCDSRWKTFQWITSKRTSSVLADKPSRMLNLDHAGG
jgi:hypothetical protein